MEEIVFLSVIFAVLTTGFCSSCTEPEVTSKSFTTQDATIVSNIAFISEFTVRCRSGEVGNLYAEVDSIVAPVSDINFNNKTSTTRTYQVSWTEEIKTARSGNKLIKIFDEEGYNAYKKVVRAGEDVSTVPVLFTVTLNHPGAFSGPWLKSEFIATVLSLSVAYFAVASRAKVVS